MCWDGTGWVVGRVPPAPIVATGAVAGTPGTFTPDGAETPTQNRITSLVADPQTAWEPGQYVTSVENSDFHWDGDSWALDEAPTPDHSSAG